MCVRDASETLRDIKFNCVLLYINPAGRKTLLRLKSAFEEEFTTQTCFCLLAMGKGMRDVVPQRVRATIGRVGIFPIAAAIGT